jgi:hypothetical protein
VDRIRIKYNIDDFDSLGHMVDHISTVLRYRLMELPVRYGFKRFVHLRHAVEGETIYEVEYDKISTTKM